MKTLEIRNGDLAVGPGGYSMVTGEQRLRQDLGVLMREAFGGDRFHPKWGGILEGFVGMVYGSEAELRVRSEINRLMQNYMMIQTALVEADLNAKRPPRIAANELLSGVDGIEIQQREDRINVRVSVRTFGGTSFSILRSVGA